MVHTLEVVDERSPSGMGFFIKVPSTGRMYRVEPARDPAQPRFWCIRIRRCTRAGVPDPIERPWLGEGGMSREDLPDALRMIQENVSGWLSQAGRHKLRGWLLEGVDETSPAVAASDPASAPAGTPPTVPAAVLEHAREEATDGQRG
jgi:hypothetical protein